MPDTSPLFSFTIQDSKYYIGTTDTVIRSLNISKSFQTSLESVNYIQEEPLPDWVPGMAFATWWPTRENTLDLALGLYHMANPKYFGQSKLPDEDRRWSYNTLTRNWTEERITLKGWSQTNRSMRVASGMTSWIPKLKKGYMFGGVFNFETSTRVEEGIYEHGGLIVYDAETNIWTNTSTPIRPVTEGGLVHLSTATDEVLIQFGGRAKRATTMVCSLSRPAPLVAFILLHGWALTALRRSHSPRSVFTAQINPNGLPIPWALVSCRPLGSPFALPSNRPQMGPATKSTCLVASRPNRAARVS